MGMGMGMGGGGGGGRVARPDDEVVGKAFDARLMRRLLPFIWEQRAQLGLGLAASAVLAVGQLSGPYLTMMAVDQGIRRADLSVLTRVALIYLTFHLLNWGATATQTWSISRAGQQVLYRLRMTLFRHLQNLSLDFYNRMAAGRIISRVTNDVESLNEFLSSGSVSAITDSAKLIGIAVIMLRLNGRLALLTFTLMPLIFLVASIFRQRSR